MRTLIYGSCVSRDMFELATPAHLELVHYIPRQSLIAAASRPASPIQSSKLENLASRFQRRVALGSLRADLLEQIDRFHADVDLILWDITDERLGVYELPGGGYITRTLELIQCGADQELQRTSRFIPFGTDEHFQLWRNGYKVWIQHLASKGIADRLILLEPRWSDFFDDGRPTPASFGVSSDEHNAMSRRYYQFARQEEFKTRSIGSTVQCVAAANHKWGAASFHFDNRTNSQFAQQLIDLLWHPVLEFPVPRPKVHPAGPGAVQISCDSTWANSFALTVLKNGEKIEHLGYRPSATFSIEGLGPGTYRFKLYHRSGEHARSSIGAPVRLPIR